MFEYEGKKKKKFLSSLSCKQAKTLLLKLPKSIQTETDTQHRKCQRGGELLRSAGLVGRWSYNKKHWAASKQREAPKLLITCNLV